MSKPMQRCTSIQHLVAVVVVVCVCVATLCSVCESKELCLKNVSVIHHRTATSLGSCTMQTLTRPSDVAKNVRQPERGEQNDEKLPFKLAHRQHGYTNSICMQLNYDDYTINHLATMPAQLVDEIDGFCSCNVTLRFTHWVLALARFIDLC